MSLVLREEEELKEYRELMSPPEEFVEGFNLKTALGALFIGFVMMPGSIYLGLVAGQTMGAAAEWVTIILFTEVARRSFIVLTRQEIYMLYYIAGGLVSVFGAAHSLSGGPFAALIWNQFLVRSPAAASFVRDIPNWVSPQPETLEQIGRTFWHSAWIPAISVIVLSQVFSKMSWIGLGYSLFRLTSDYEKLSFPLAPVAAAGATALAEVQAQREAWRWRIFSIGSMLGVVFGAIYVGVPTLTGLVLVRPIHILPIPWIDFTQGLDRILPASAVGIGTSLALVLVGFVLPFWVVVGGFAAAMATVFLNPILYKAGLLTSWRPGMDTIRTSFVNWLDFWLSFGIGVSLSVALLGFYKMYVSLRSPRHPIAQSPNQRTTNPLTHPFTYSTSKRGDFPIWAAIGMYIVATGGIVIMSSKLVRGFPIWFFLLYGYLYSPFISYVSARMTGLTGQSVDIPMVREATFILSRYKGIDIWFAPLPLGNYGTMAQRFREVELTGTRFTSVLKAEAVMFVVLMFCSFIFWSYIWGLSDIPSPMYRYAQQFWHLIAMQQCLWITATTERSEVFMEAIKGNVILSGLGFGLGGYTLFSWLGWPVMAIYGFIRGLGSLPHFILPEIIGALLGRYYFAQRLGEREWRQYAPVLLAGFSCGMGLIGMVAIAMALISQSIAQLPY